MSACDLLAIGIWGGIAGLGVALGPLIGGAVVQGWNWQAIFWLNVPVGIISVPLVLLCLPNSFGERVRADVVGLLLAGLGVLGLGLRHRARQPGRLGQLRGASGHSSPEPSCSSLS